jgi:IS30 family transposase
VIEKMGSQGASIRQVARQLGRAASTVSRAVRRRRSEDSRCSERARLIQGLIRICWVRVAASAWRQAAICA